MRLLVLGLLYLAILYAVGKTAEAKGRRPFPWIALALFLGILTFIPLWVAGDSREKILQAAEEDEKDRPRARKDPIVAVLVGLAAAMLVGLYIHGTFDRSLLGTGLNFHACARNGFGATFCGKELDEYRERISRAKEAVGEHLEESERKSREEISAGEQTAATEARERRAEQINSLREKMARERRIYESEPEGSVSSDLAKGEYEGARAELQQLQVE